MNIKIIKSNAPRITEENLNALVALGALYIDETGIHASKAGVYPKENSTQTVKS